MALDITAITADGYIDEHEVSLIRADIFGEHGDEGSDVSEAELRMVDEIKNGVTFGEWTTSFADTYVEAVVNYAARDGEVDAGEAAVLNELFGADGTIDALEARALTALRQSGATIHESLMG